MSSIFDEIRFPCADSGVQIYKMLIDGEWVESSNKAVLDIVNPFDKSIVGKVPKGTREDAEAAVRAAFDAKDKIAKMTAFERAKILNRIAEIIEENRDIFRDTIVLEAGKPVKVAEGEVSATIERFRFAADEVKQVYGEAILGDEVPWHPEKIGIVLRKPLGLVLAICPFNYPLYIGTSKIAPAIAAGNSVVVKPAGDDPICILMLAKVMQDAGMPAGVINVVTGSASEIGDVLVGSEEVDMVSFTGSTAVGHHAARLAGMKRLQMELGGKSPGIVLEDADLSITAKECVTGALKFSGQRCDAISRILVVDKVARAFVGKVVSEVKKWKSGDPRNTDTSIGPLINKRALDKVDELVLDAVSKGAKVLAGGRRGEGLFYEPTILDHVTTDMRIAWEETFGPVVTIIHVADYETAIRIANESEFALDSSVFTNDINKAINAGLRIDSGTVQINAAPAHGIGNFPFGGDKESGMGREGIKRSIDEMTTLHTIVFNPK
ncbi:MAG: NADP-dependent glyceraldehyde-3-phosphate dehydrogenase [Candidatus Nanohalarchaeota archaeon]|nr:MAG: NADP-dependent glyceraldehyde-3-phosphate dehydrogenase [Candidatus Nanohaloarchaeota archaeon]